MVFFLIILLIILLRSHLFLTLEELVLNLGSFIKFDIFAYSQNSLNCLSFAIAKTISPSFALTVWYGTIEG